MMKITRWSRYSKSRVPDNWEDMLVELWREDDAPVPDKERTHEALKRLFPYESFTKNTTVRSVDHGDSGGDLYDNGVFVGWSCEGGWISVLAVAYEEVKYNPRGFNI